MGCRATAVRDKRVLMIGGAKGIGCVVAKEFASPTAGVLSQSSILAMGLVAGRRALRTLYAASKLATPGW